MTSIHYTHVHITGNHIFKMRNRHFKHADVYSLTLRLTTFA